MSGNRIENTIRRLEGSMGAGFRAIYARPVVRTAVNALGRGALGFILSRAQVMGGPAPFGLSWAAAGGGIDAGGIASMLGSAGGYWLDRHVEGTLLTAAVLILFAVVLLLGHKGRKAWHRPLLASLAYISTATPYLVAARFPAQELARFTTNLILSGGCTYFYERALSEAGEGERRRQRDLSRLILLMCGLMALSPVTVAPNVSLGRALAVLLVMAAARTGGFGWGSAAGVCAGLSMDIALGEGPFFSMAYAFAGMLSGVFCERSRIMSAVSYVLAGAVAALWAPSGAVRLALFYETFAASVIFMLIPEHPMEEARGHLLPPSPDDGAKIRSFWRDRLKNSARAFRELYECMNRAFSSGKRSDPDPAHIYTRAADKVCKKCPSSSRCWASPMSAARSAANDAMQTVLNKGCAAKEDFKPHFIGACPNADAFVAAVDSEVKKYIEQRSRKARERENSRLLCRQYSELSHILSQCAEEFGSELSFDMPARRRLKKFMSTLGLDTNVTVFRGEHSRLHVELEGDALEDIPDAEALAGEISRHLGAKMCLSEEIKGTAGRRICFLETEPLRAIAGAASGRRTGESTSGDSGTYFKTHRGELYVLLSDGMGSGQEAARESRLTLGVIERFLRAGVSPRIALRTVDSALLLKNREDGQFATLDLLHLDLFTGECSVYKFGAAPTYIKRGSSVNRAGRCSLPIGTGTARQGPEQTKFILTQGDFIVMASDGLADRDDDAWVMELLRQYSGTSPRQLAANLLAEGARRSGAADDITVYVLRLEKTDS